MYIAGLELPCDRVEWYFYGDHHVLVARKGQGGCVLLLCSTGGISYLGAD